MIRELAGPYGIPDLVAVVGDQQAAHDRLALGVPPLLNELDAAIVATAAPRAPRSTITLARRLGWDTPTVLSRMPRLLQIGALSEVGPGVVVRATALKPIGRLYAIETKVANWRRAVRQGRNYQLWCDSYVVVMDALGVAPLEGLLAAAREDGAGVVIGGRWRARARVRGRSDWRRFWGSEYVVAALGHGSVPLIGTVSEQAV